MQKYSYAQIVAVKSNNVKRIIDICPNCPNTSGIYFLLREEDGFKYAYIGQSVHMLDRLAEHLSGYQHIDLSLKKHGFKSQDNPTGYTVNYIPYPTEELDEREQYFIKLYANNGYQLRNATAGGQNAGKNGLGNQRPPRGYFDGVKHGCKSSREYVKTMFDKYLTYGTQKQPPNKLQERKFKEFEEWLNGN